MRQDPRFTDELRATVAASRAAQGLPPTVEDPLALGTVAALLASVTSQVVTGAPTAIEAA